MAYADILRSTTRTRNDEAGLIDGLLAAQISGSYLYAGTSTGSANAHAGSLTQAPASYTSGISISFKAGYTNTATATFNLNGLGAVTILNAKTGGALIGNEIVVNGVFFLEYIGSNFYLINGRTGASVFTTTIAQGGNVTFTNTESIYYVEHNLIDWQAKLTITGAGTGGNNALINLPATSVHAEVKTAIGAALIIDSSTNAYYNCVAVIASGSQLGFVHDTTTANYWGASPSVGLASGDIVTFRIRYKIG